MVVRKLRLERGWSQEQLAQLSGLSVRTIQRIERGQTPGLDSLNSLAAVFDVHVSDLQRENDMNMENPVDAEAQQALRKVRRLKKFYAHALKYGVVISILFLINLTTSPGYIWAVWPMLGWGIGLALHGLKAYEIVNLFGPNWEQRQVEKQLGRKP